MAPELSPELRPVAQRLFGERLPLAEEFVRLLADQGVTRGLVGPREVDRLWERHLINCALMVDALPGDARSLADVGSGAGLPGVVLAIARPGLEITLIETMQRRATWLQEVDETLDLGVEVLRARAEDLHGQREFDVVTARAVAALDKLARWCLPLVREGGHLVVMKGSSAQQEIDDAAAVLRRLGGEDPRVSIHGDGEVEVPTTVVTVRAGVRPTRRGGPRGR
ncbi:16S rRNA (guanine(527)-N(7))-methyltransferase RsmG [Brachybacterium sp. EF45031]|uniref:16S rRNA (guanine(527)-N(7))-methyltransferase RsmG n=1 Tax=Brachybacterium sillae TaxID=2810536 RepID=UPI00217DFE0A|nr:16S rRNA (guanine(527)-N(7))-methyltransferase RsmG [Brachybacterium sillae]MCS6711852.1 16S rRNA (guanine(527)-N(7))-methyltransferase RsmG [Brachybacterium sillae]